MNYVTGKWLPSHKDAPRPAFNLDDAVTAALSRLRIALDANVEYELKQWRAWTKERNYEFHSGWFADNLGRSMKAVAQAQVGYIARGAIGAGQAVSYSDVYDPPQRKGLSFLLGAALLAGSFGAQALDLTGSVGHTMTTRTDNGIWRQDGFPYSFDYTSQSYSVGLSGYAFSQTRYHLEYTRLFQVTAHAKGVPDDVYNGSNGCVAACPPLSDFHTEGSVRGFSATLAPEWSVGGGYKVFVEGGAFVFLPKFLAQAKDATTADYTWQNEYREGWKAGPQLGFGGEYKSTQLVLTAYYVDAPTPDWNAIPNWTGWAYNARLRYLKNLL